MKPTMPALRGENGVVLIAGLLLTLALVMLIGTAVDIGNAFIVHRQLVALADQAALTGSQQLDINALHQQTIALDPDLARTSALQALAGQPDITANAEATQTAVHVDVSETVPTLLLRLVGLNTLTLSAHARAAPKTP
jgi:Flp pilus assembly protein TadG